jgi:hypothetical protein
MWKLYAMEIKYPTGMESADDLIVDEIRRQRSVGLNAYYEDPSFPATDASLFKVRRARRPPARLCAAVRTHVR